jgi:hypothetical protein
MPYAPEGATENMNGNNKLTKRNWLETKEFQSQAANYT